MLTEQELKSMYEADDPALRASNSRKMITISWEINQVAAEAIYKYLSDRGDLDIAGTFMREACIESFSPPFQRSSYLPCKVGHDLGDRESSKRLAKILWRGDLFIKDIPQAREIYAGIVTAESDPESEFYYGALSYNSTDIPGLKVNSACWIKQAAQKGFDKAKAFYDDIKHDFPNIPDDCIPLTF